MTSTLPRRRRRTRGLFPIARLDPRIVPAALLDTLSGVAAGSTSPVLAVDPAPGASLRAGPTLVDTTFAQPIDPGSLSGTDLRLDSLGPGGVWTPYSSASPPVEALDATGAQLSLSTDKPLEPGRYRLVLDGNNTLFGLDGNSVSSTGQDLILGEFTVLRPGVKLADAVPLGVVSTGATPSAVAGSLDLSADPEAVALYKVTVPAGHTWRLGLEVDAQSQGSTLAAGLSLLDARGHVLATGAIGRASAPADPYLFQNVGPGTYYIGVSTAGNLPGVAGGYDAVAGVEGSAAQPQRGGAFTLRLVADAADAPTVVSGFTLGHADPRDPTPTTLSVSYSGPIRAEPAAPTAGNLAAGYRLLDGYGRSWPICIATVSERTGRVDLAVRDRLPAGHYTLQTSTTAPPLDLGGRPIKGTGVDPSLIGRFDVAPAAPATPGDLGTLYPDDLDAGTGKDVSLSPGQGVDLHATVLATDSYQVSVAAQGGGLSAALLDARGRVVAQLPVGTPAHPASQLLRLDAGSYTLRLSTTGGGPAISARVSISTPGSWPEKLLDNGVGQGPALNLRLASPVAADDAPSGSSPGAVAHVEPSTPAASTSLGSSPAAAFAAASLGAVGPVSTPAAVAPTAPANAPAPATPGVFLALGGEPVGRPSPEPSAAAATPGISTEGAGSSAAIGQSIALSGPSGGFGFGLATPAASPVPAEVPGAPGADALAGLRLAEPPATAEPTIEAAEGWRAGLDRLVAGLVGGDAPTAPTSDDLPADPDASAVAVAAADIPAESAPAEPAGLVLPAGIGLVAALGLRARRYIDRRKAARLPGTPRVSA